MIVKEQSKMNYNKYKNGYNNNNSITDKNNNNKKIKKYTYI